MPAKLPLIMAGLLLSVAALLAACGSSTEEVSPTTAQPAPSTATATAAPTATASPTGGAGGGGDGTLIPVQPLPSPQPIPSDWATYQDPDGRFILRYPSDWYLEDGARLKQRRPGELATILTNYPPPRPGAGPRFREGAIKLDLLVQPGGANLCPPPDGAATVSLGGVPGWQRILSFAPSYSAAVDGLTRLHSIVAWHNGYCYNFDAYFAQDDPDEMTFLQIVSSFEFTK